MSIQLLSHSPLIMMSTASDTSSSLIPPTVVIEGHRLVDAKKAIRNGDATLNKAFQQLKVQADRWMHQGPWTVTAKTKLAPSGNSHDYASQAPYWWPNPDTPTGHPYHVRDGEVNPEVNEYLDGTFVEKLYASTYLLSLAWFYTGEAKYSHHAGRILRTWFLNPATAMNPHLNHAQVIPGINTGQGTGIIDFSCDYTSVLDAVAILSIGAPGWSEEDQAAFKDWNRKFLVWLIESTNGKEAFNRSNNHGTFAAMLICALALFTDNREAATEAVNRAKTLINTQIAPDGSQPEEMDRKCSWHYSNFNLVAYLRLALMAQRVDVDLFKYEGSQGQGIFKAVQFLIPAALQGKGRWPRKDIDFKIYAATDILHAAANGGFGPAQEIVGKLIAPLDGDLFYLRPAPQQLHRATALSHSVR